MLRSGQVQPFTLIRKSTWRKPKRLYSIKSFYNAIKERRVYHNRRLFNRCDKTSDAPSGVRYPRVCFAALEDAPGFTPDLYFNDPTAAVPPPSPEPPDGAEDDLESAPPDFLERETPILDGELVVRPNFIAQAAPTPKSLNFHWKFWAFLATALIGFALSQSVSAFWVAFLVLCVAVCAGIAVYFVCADSFDVAKAEEIARRNREHAEHNRRVFERVQQIFAFREAKMRDVQRKLQTFRTETLAETQYLSDIKQRLREAEKAQRQKLNEEFSKNVLTYIENERRLRQEKEEQRQKLSAEFATARRTLLDFERRLREESRRRYQEFIERAEEIEKRLNQREIEQEQRDRKYRVIAEEIARHYLTLVCADVAKKLNPNNYATCKERLTVAYESCYVLGLCSAQEREDALTSLKSEYETRVRAAEERELQTLIKRQIREEEKTRRRLKEAEERARREKEAVEKKLAEERKQIALIEKRIREARADERARLKRELETSRFHQQILAEWLENALAKIEDCQRATSQAELTKAGHVYILSNEGSFGPGVYKIGMTRRLDPRVRVAELSSASVLFTFDVHMLHPCENAPALEHELHQALSRYRVNKAKPKKEFSSRFRSKRLCRKSSEFAATPSSLSAKRKWRNTAKRFAWPSRPKTPSSSPTSAKRFVANYIAITFNRNSISNFTKTTKR